MGNIEEMRESFQGWDPRLTHMIAQLNTALKWKLCHHEELETWVKGSVALLGDASHPTLPYQAQGAAMAVEDGAVIGTLLGRLQVSLDLEPRKDQPEIVSEILSLYESLRKKRTTTNVQGMCDNDVLDSTDDRDAGAVACQDFYHLRDGDEQVYRDGLLQQYDCTGKWPANCKWNWGDAGYQQALLGFDAVDDAHRQFDIWRERRQSSPLG
jgi:salicylate hydroxylase